MSMLFSQTLREAPTDAEMPSHKLLVRAGFIRQLAAGIYTAMPLAKRSITKIENIMRDEINAIGGQEMTMPVVHPAEVWQETERWYQVGSEMGRFKDKNDRDMVLAMTHEEVVADLTRKEIHSYRQLPVLIYHIQTKWRDDPRPRAGLIRVREFTMKDSYSLDADWEGLDKQYRAHYQAYFDIFHRCGIPVIAVKSDVGMMGGKVAHEYMYLTPHGEDTLLICNNCGYAANRQVATFKKEALPKEEALPLEKVATPDCKTIAELAEFLDIPEAKTAKAVFMVADIPVGESSIQKFIFAIVRGDMDLNETKLVNALQASDIRPATEEEIVAIGAVPGYASPIGLPEKSAYLPVVTVVDDLLTESQNLVAGANDASYHMLNTNLGRDYQADIITDLTAARAGDACSECGGSFREVRGVEVGNIFKLGTRYSDSMGCTFQDKDGKEKPVIMGSYGIGSGRLLASVAEEYNDEYGLIWPITVAPYQVHLVMLSAKKGDGTVEETAAQLYQDLQAGSVEVLFDDRQESPGVKFNDADLIGLPIRLTVGARGLEGGNIEFKRRDQKEKRLISQDEIIEAVKAEIATLEAEIKAEVVAVTFDE
ncbi:MAG: proline--tRNA ligase [Anaerolineales bacterium]|nr:proline--tRNA ligase [Chloroflexota bacterium]MBL7161861.1 proline--tRNA ligase [Anaerolineales bacterium]